MAERENQGIQSKVAQLVTEIAIIRTQLESLESLGHRRDRAIEKLDDAAKELQLTGRERAQNWKLALVLAAGLMTLVLGFLLALATGALNSK
jgi:septal ring factor EnvC (AmiA/AmiB activator)